uniref:Protein ENL-like n=1 Tax=Nicotiana tabacum TaxID=4097 RepID=A0A1S4BNF6_TOBAC|nr:PREDICTED: protein ENL-like [Nicotiana tabacum]
MTNPQDNPGTPPPPTPSNSSTPPPPSTSPKPRLRRKLNEQLKASQAQDSNSNSDSESYKSASEGEGPGSSYSEKAQESPSKVISSVTENLENRFILVGPIRDVELPELRRIGEIIEESGKKLGGSGSGKAAEGLVNLSAQGDEPGSSTEKTLADLLKKGRATRSRVKQSESDLQKALAESKKKRMDKGKGKVVESSEAVKVEEMEQVHQEKVTIVEGKLLKDLVEPGRMRLVDALAA